MRLSAIPGDAGHRAYIEARRAGRRIHVFLDGKSQRDVVTADDKAGVVHRHVRGAQGFLVHNGDGFVLSIIHGRVAIAIEEPLPCEVA